MVRLLSVLFFCLRKLFIKNSDLPTCVDCKFIIPYKNDLTLSKCQKFGEKNIITGEIEYTYVSICRNYDNMCGLSGKLFEPVDPENKTTCRNTEPNSEI